MKKLPNLSDLITNFNTCLNTEEKFHYLIKLGTNLPLNKQNIRNNNNIIHGCQNKIWIYINKYPELIINADSNTLIMKGILMILIVIYTHMKYKNINIINNKIIYVFKKINLINYINSNTFIGIKSIINNINKKIWT